jgi:hypothetical protein
MLPRRKAKRSAVLVWWVWPFVLFTILAALVEFRRKG